MFASIFEKKRKKAQNVSVALTVNPAPAVAKKIKSKNLGRRLYLRPFYINWDLAGSLEN